MSGQHALCTWCMRPAARTALVAYDRPGQFCCIRFDSSVRVTHNGAVDLRPPPRDIHSPAWISVAGSGAQIWGRRGAARSAAVYWIGLMVAICFGRLRMTAPSLSVSAAGAASLNVPLSMAVVRHWPFGSSQAENSSHCTLGSNGW